MIHVQIASDITTVGVEGVRWVLVEASEAEPPAAPAPLPMVPTAAIALAAAPPERTGQGRIGLWQLAITGLGLLAAVGLAQRQLGLPKLPWLDAPAISLPVAAPPAAPTTDAARVSPAPALPAPPDSRPAAEPTLSDHPGPAQPTPAASAAQTDRLITAGLR